MVWFVFSAVLATFVTTTSRSEILPPDRRVDWINYPPGVQGGIVDRTTIFTNMTGLDATGRSNVGPEIQSAIDRCPSNQVVLLPPGQFLLQQTLMMKSDITLRGAGMNSTTLVFSNGSGSAISFPLSSLENIYYPSNNPAHFNNVAGGAVRGATNFVLAPGPYLSDYTAGRFVLIDQLHDPAIFGGTLEPYGYMGRQDGARMMRQIVEILSVSGGTHVTCSPPLVWTYTNSPQVVHLPKVHRRAGIENLCVSNAWPVYAGGNNIEFRQTVDCWVKECAIRRSAYAGIFAWHAFRCTFVGNDIRYNITYHTSNRSYALLLANGTSDCLVEDNIVYYCRSGLMAAACAARNVFAYNYAPHSWNEGTGLLTTLNVNHGGNPSFTLWEGNVGTGFKADLFHGGSAFNILLRNAVAGWQANASSSSPDSYQRAVVLCASNYFYSLLGNVLGDEGLVNSRHATWTYESTPQDSSNLKPYIYRLGFLGPGENTNGWDAATAATAIRHGNYDEATDSVVSDPGIASQTLPNSYYLSSKPEWFGALPWPPIGPDRDPRAGRIPAQARFLSEKGAVPGPPLISGLDAP